MIAVPYIVENALLGLGALVALGLTIHQVFIDVVTERAQHHLLRVTHAVTLVSAITFVFVQFDPKAIYGMYTQSAINFLKSLTVLFIFMGAQCLMVTYVYALATTSLGKRPVYLIRALQISSAVYSVVLLSLMIGEASVNGAYFAGVPLLCEACYCLYLMIFSLYATMDLKRALVAHSNTKAGATTQLGGALKRIRNVQLIVVSLCVLGMAYQVYIGVGLLLLPPSVPVPNTNPSVYSALTPVANIITLACIFGLVYGGYHSKRTANLKPTVQDSSAISSDKISQSSSHIDLERPRSSANLQSSGHLDTRKLGGGNSQTDPEPL